MAGLSIRNVHKTYPNGTDVLKGINIDIDEGQFLVLVGGSGCGKSTLLNMIAGLETISAGEIRIGDRVVNDLPPKDRDIAMVFQSYALYPSMTVRENIAFSLSIRKVPKAEQERVVQRVAETLQITALLDRRPAQLSGGQRQRVAMGRAIARQPAIYLFDEPLSNLDAKLRVEMRAEMKLMHQRLGTTIVYVTHDQIEAMTLGDRIAVMKDGLVQQFATPQEIYDNPANQFVAGFIGSPSMNFIPCKLETAGKNLAVKIENNGRHELLNIPMNVSEINGHIGNSVLLGIRPENITDTRGGMQNQNGQQISVKVDLIEPTGPDTMVFVTLNNTKVTCRAHPTQVAKPGDEMSITLDISKALLFDPASGARLA